MKWLSKLIITSLLFITWQTFAASCLNVFPAAYQGNYSGSSNVLMNIPTNNSSASLTNNTTLAIGDNFYKQSSLSNNGKVFVANQTGSQHTARLFINSSVNWVNPQINKNGNPEDLIIYINGALTITKNAQINAIIYVTGSVNITKNAKITGSITSLGTMSVSNKATITYQQSYVSNANFNGMCSGTTSIPISCTTNLPALAYSDTFGTASTVWSTQDFTRSVSNWPGQSIYNSSGESQTVQYSISGGKLAISGSVSSQGDNEYGMVKNTLAQSNIQTNINSYALSADYTANASSSLNNDMGLVFGYVDSSNYYMARWTKYGSSYSSDSTFPGIYRRLELIQLVNGVATSLTRKDNFSVADPFNLKVVVNNQGTAVCVNDTAELYSASTQPQLNDIGIYSYDNDTGISVDNVQLYCDNCLNATPKADYRFDECSYSGASNEVIDQTGNYNAQSFNSLNTASNGKIERYAAFSTYSHRIETSISTGTTYSIMTWFKKPTSTTDSPYFILASLQGGGDLLYLDRTNNWKWGIYNAVGNTSTSGSYSFASLDNNWHHLTVVYNGGQSQLYIDGSLVDTVNAVPSNSNATIKYIGTSFDNVGTSNAQGWRTPLDEFILFDAAISATQISQIYNNQAAGKNYDGTTRAAVSCSALVAKYSFEQTSFGSGVTDDSGNGHTGASINGASIAGGKYCRGFDSNGTNTSSITSNAFNSNVHLLNDVGTKGTISFWYKSNTVWNQGGYNGGGEKTLFDASLDVGSGGANKYFHLRVMSDGNLQFLFEDSADADLRFNENTTPRLANTWYYISATWDYTNDSFAIYVDGNLAVSATKNTNGLMKDLGNIIFGDNSSTYTSNANSALASSTSANGQFDEIRIYSKVLSQAEIQADMNDSGGCTSVDHYEIIHDGSALTCEAETITLKACADAACNTLASDAISLNVQGNGTTKASASFTGSTTVNISHSVAETLTLSLANINVAPVNATVCSDGSGNSCDLAFKDTGFRFLVDGAANNIPTQLSGKPSNIGYNSSSISLQAIEKNPDTGACQAVLTAPAQIKLAAKCTNPTTCAGQQVMINGTNIPTLDNASALSYQTVTLDFSNGTSNSAPVVINYPDAGRIQLFAEFTAPTGKVLQGSSNGFVVRPFGFYMNASGNPAAIDANGSKYKKAGESFNATVTAVQWQSGEDNNNDGKPDNFSSLSNNPITPNFGNESNAEQVVIASTLVAPLGGNNPTLTNATFSGFSAGSATNTMSWPEVGILQFDAALQDNQYIGTSNVLGQIPYVGRFYPDHFDIATTNGAFKASCTAGTTPFSYIGQAFSYDSANLPSVKITAKALAGETTQNYTQGGFLKLTAADVTRNFPTQDSINKGADASTLLAVTPTSSAGVLNNPATPGETLTNGEMRYVFSGSDSFTYDKNSNSKIAPLTAMAYDITLTSIGDGEVTTNYTSSNTIRPAGITQYFGRLAIANSFGPETVALTLPMTTEYWDGSNFVVNASDSCTSYDLSNTANYTLDNTGINPAINTSVTSASGAGTFANGTGSFTLAAPSDGSQGGIRITYDSTPIWLRYNWSGGTSYTDKPSAIATFGQYRGNDRIIYWRERHNN